MKKFYLVAMIIGAAAPLYLFSQHFAVRGFGLSDFVIASFPNPVASGLVTDLIISAALGLIVFGREARALGVRGFWAVALGTILIGFSFGFPLYLYLRELRSEASKSHSYRAATP
ncbi:MAG TPA: DUF2834 domain-containing protein [Blastocatellia bacterium]|nr:DUF2834 domain-containing protein [Blastocatellia bacterium]